MNKRRFSTVMVYCRIACSAIFTSTISVVRLKSKKEKLDDLLDDLQKKKEIKDQHRISPQSYQCIMAIQVMRI